MKLGILIILIGFAWCVRSYLMRPKPLPVEHHAEVMVYNNNWILDTEEENDERTICIWSYAPAREPEVGTVAFGDWVYVDHEWQFTQGQISSDKAFSCNRLLTKPELDFIQNGGDVSKIAGCKTFPLKSEKENSSVSQQTSFRRYKS